MRFPDQHLDRLLDYVIETVVDRLLADERINEKPAAPGRALPRVGDGVAEDSLNYQARAS